MTRQRRARPEDDRGVVLVLVTLIMVVLLTATALVIDLGMVRQNRQADKSATDFAAAAGVRALGNDDTGLTQPWRGVCAAREYLMANNDELDGMTGTYANGNGASHGSDPCASPGSSPFTTMCSDTDESTWAVYSGQADGGRVRVTIESGYDLPDPDFAEDTNASYSGDAATPCEQIAVIIDEGEGPYFGGIVGSSGHTTRIRSVGRLEIGDIGNATAALLLLERTDCEVLFIGGNSGAAVIVEGFGDTPGIIHADSLGNGDRCKPTDLQNGKIFQVNSNPSVPSIIARRALEPIGAEAPGLISAVALSGAAGAVPDAVTSPSPKEVCAQDLPTDCEPAAMITGLRPTGRALVGRGPLDERYRDHILDLRDNLDYGAAVRFGWSTEADLPHGWTRVGVDDCDAEPVTFTDPKIWVDCEGGEFRGNGKTFAAGVDEVVINGYIVVDGNNNRLQFVEPSTLYVKGLSGGGGVVLKGNNNQILVNDGGLADGNADGFVCDDRYAEDPAARTKMVIRNGGLLTEGGGSGKVLRLCSTTLFMMDDSGSPGCPVPDIDGRAPYDNGCGGRIRVAGGSSLDWSAPNVNDVFSPTPEQLKQFEDLAFWSETQGLSPTSTIAGGGAVRLSGIFFTPNADPFEVVGNGDYDITEAQFISRRLTVAGNGRLLMHPQPQNALQVPLFGGFGLVR